MKQIDFMAEYSRLNRLSEMGDPLEKISGTIDWELFRSTLESATRKETGGVGGRPPYDCVMMFKIVMLQQWYGIADDNTEYLINDRLSFQRFLGLSLGDRVPDAKTVWLFREKLTKSGVGRKLFTLFERQMERAHVITRKGSIVDATFVEVPRQRNTKEENRLLKEGKTPPEWEREKNIHKIRQKDCDARWTKKRETAHYGYKNHVKADKDSKMIVSFSVTDASVHDSKEIESLIDIRDKELYADSAYTQTSFLAYARIRRKAKNLEIKIHERGYRGKSLTETQKSSNREKSKTRARVEHIFGFMKTSMGGSFVRCIGIERAAYVIAMKNLAYNMKRYIYLARQGISIPI